MCFCGKNIDIYGQPSEVNFGDTGLMFNPEMNADLRLEKRILFLSQNE